MGDTERTCWYVTSPLSTHGTPLYEHMQLEVIPAVLEQIQPGKRHTIVYARGLYSGGKDWQNKWPLFRSEWAKDGLLFFTDETGYIGKGVWSEIIDVLHVLKRPIYLVTVNGDYFPIDNLQRSGIVHFSGEDELSWHKYVRITLTEQ